MEKTIVYCDLCKGVEKVEKQVGVPVRFTTEQTEGRSCTPYLDSVRLDICEKCLKTIIDGQPLSATGAMGGNTYTLKSL